MTGKVQLEAVVHGRPVLWGHSETNPTANIPPLLKNSDGGLCIKW